MGGNNSSTVSDDSSPEPRDLLELRASHADATSELAATKKEIILLKQRLEQSNDKLNDIADKEDEMMEQRNMLLLECHDALLHPCIGFAEAAHHPDVREYQELPLRAAAPPTQQRSETTSANGAPEGEEGEEEEVEPTLSADETAAEEYQRYKQEYKNILTQRRFLDSQFQEILGVLEKGRETVEGNVFHLERRITPMEENLLRAQHEVERLALELGGEERKFTAQRSLAQVGSLSAKRVSEGEGEQLSLTENPSSTTASGAADSSDDVEGLLTLAAEEDNCATSTGKRGAKENDEEVEEVKETSSRSSGSGEPSLSIQTDDVKLNIA